MKKAIFILFYVCFLFSCRNEKSGEKNENDSIEKKIDTSTINQINIKKTSIHEDGPFVEKYENGQIKIEGTYKNGTRFGLWKSYYDDGTHCSEDYFEDGKKNGKTATFYKTGRVRYIGYFTWDKPSGVWEFYSEDGKLDKQKDYSKQ